MLNQETSTGDPVLAYWDLEDDKIVVFYKAPHSVLTIEPQDFERYLDQETSHLKTELKYTNPDDGLEYLHISTMSLPEFIENTSARALAKIANEYVTSRKLQAA